MAKRERAPESDGRPRLSPTRVREALRRAALYGRTGRLAEARTLYRSVLAARPDHRETLKACALVAFRLDAVDEAAALMQRAVALDAGDAGAHNEPRQRAPGRRPPRCRARRLPPRGRARPRERRGARQSGPGAAPRGRPRWRCRRPRPGGRAPPRPCRHPAPHRPHPPRQGRPRRCGLRLPPRARRRARPCRGPIRPGECPPCPG